MSNQALEALNGLIGSWKLTLSDAWEASDDQGRTWRKDFDLLYVRAQAGLDGSPASG